MEYKSNETQVAVAAWFQKPKSRYQQLAVEVIREMRGKISQRALSQKLGFTFNQVGKWENSSTKIKFNEFLKVAFVLDYPMESILRRYFYTLDGPLTEDNIIGALQSISSMPVTAVPCFTRNRPDFADFLEAIDSRPSHMMAWLSEFLDCSKLKSVRAHYESYLERMNIVSLYPMTPLVYAALQLQAYQELPHHDESFLALHGACTEAQVREVLGHLIKSGWIIFDGQKYKCSPLDFGFSTVAKDQLRGMTKFVTELAAQRYPLKRIRTQEGLNVGQSGFRAIALSYEGSLKARDLLLKFQADIADLAAQDKGPKNNVQILLAHSFPSTICSGVANEAISNNRSSSAPHSDLTNQTS